AGEGEVEEGAEEAVVLRLLTPAGLRTPVATGSARAARSVATRSARTARTARTTGASRRRASGRRASGRRSRGRRAERRGPRRRASRTAGGLPGGRRTIAPWCRTRRAEALRRVLAPLTRRPGRAGRRVLGHVHLPTLDLDNAHERSRRRLPTS